MDEVRKVRTHLREVRKSDDAPSYKLKLSDVVTKFDSEIFLGRLTDEEHDALFQESEPEQYADDEGDQRPPIATVPRRRKLLDKIPCAPRRLPLRPRCETKAFKDMMSVKQPWDRMKHLVQTKPLKVNLLDIVGYEEVKEELHSKLVDNVDRLLEERRNCPNIDPRKQQTLSVLLYVPVGTGKTQLSDAIANEASQCVYIKCKSSDLLGKYRGKSSKAIDFLFQMAGALGPSIIFIDECEDLLASRDSDMGKSPTDMSSIILQNITTHTNVSFLCATNLPWSLDAGFIRRFASKHLVGLPNEQQRAVIFKKLFGQIFSVITDKEYNQIAQKYDGLSGSDISQ
jgi:SpoVK/Ycf46/Vps4 family AAA+-type ATPase